MGNKKISPKINSIKWGTVLVADENSYKDAKLFPGGSRTWDWNETGTSHNPGIQPADVKELLEHGAETLVLSKGFNERLKTKPETEQYLDDNEVSYHILETEEAVSKYNQLRKTKPTGALIHSTC